AGKGAPIVSAKVAALAQGVLKAMLLTKLKMPAVLLVLGGMVAAGGGVLHHLVAASEQAGTFKTAKAGNVPAAAVEATQKDSAKQTPDVIPSKEQLLDYLNDNARRVESLRCADVDLTCTQGIKSFSLRGSMVAQRPRNFRLSAKTLGRPVIDIGSNDQEFWYWISKANPPYQDYCSHKDLHEGRGRRVPFPFQPEWVMQAIGLGPYGLPEKYKLEWEEDTLRLVEKTTSPQGKPLRSIIVLKRNEARVPNPQVLAHLLLDDASGHEVCSAHIKETKLDRHTGAILPRRIEFRCNMTNQTLRLVMKLDGLSVNSECPPELFKRPMPEGVRAYNIAAEPPEKDE
ncbi:MAG TPA: hypothetical protein VNX28_00200, partial [Gemmataceae bacterium]|nr:hypothetical protein [Gemmataceae bacterium]